MSYDGIVTKAVVEELKINLIGGRIDKVYQQENDEILINIRSNRNNYRLILSASSNNPRIYLTDFSKKNPDHPPMFCMLLRKHLIGGTILDIGQFLLDRIVYIDISAIDELGQPTEKRLIIEIMGRHSNIILIDKENYKILDSIKRVSENISRVRQVLPGMIYEYPPLGDKMDPRQVSKEDFFASLKQSEQNLAIYKFFYFNYLGLSPLISREICFLADLDIDRTIFSLDDGDKTKLYDTFSYLMDQVSKGQFNPVAIMGREAIKAFHALELKQFGEENKVFNDSISQVLDNYYNRKDIEDRVGQKSQSIRKSIQVKLDRALNKLAKQKEELLDSLDRDKYKVYADLISANIHNIPRGKDSVKLENFYDENMETLLIPLDIKLSPVANAQKYYKRYSKLKNAHSLLEQQIPETKSEIEYLENVLFSIENASEVEELDEIKEELIIEGYIRSSSRNKKKKDNLISKPLHFISQDNFNIYVGKNNRQNEYLTLKLAKKDDLWFHVQSMPGSHVIIERNNRDVSDKTLEEAALLAAYFSKAKNSNNVPVDFTEKKHVRKARNGKIGMVIYENFKTIFVSPSAEAVDKIKKVEK